MSPLAHHFATEAYQNAWANHRLLKACSQLTQEEFAATRTSFFPSIKATLNHILTVDWYYLETLERSRAGLPPHEDPGRHYEPEEPFDTCEALSREQHAADKRLIAYCESLGDFEHQLHHRGQAHAMLAGTRVKPPQLDEFFCTEEAHLRAKDFEELGFSEEMIWGDRVVAPA